MGKLKEGRRGLHPGAHEGGRSGPQAGSRPDEHEGGWGGQHAARLILSGESPAGPSCRVELRFPMGEGRSPPGGGMSKIKSWLRPGSTPQGGITRAPFLAPDETLPRMALTSKGKDDKGWSVTGRGGARASEVPNEGPALKVEMMKKKSHRTVIQGGTHPPSSIPPSP